MAQIFENTWLIMIFNETALETYILSSSLPQIKSAWNLFFQFLFKIEQNRSSELGIHYFTILLMRSLTMKQFSFDYLDKLMAARVCSYKINWTCPDLFFLFLDFKILLSDKIIRKKNEPFLFFFDFYLPFWLWFSYSVSYNPITASVISPRKSD